MGIPVVIVASRTTGNEVTALLIHFLWMTKYDDTSSDSYTTKAYTVRGRLLKSMNGHTPRHSLVFLKIIRSHHYHHQQLEQKKRQQQGQSFVSYHPPPLRGTEGTPSTSVAILCLKADIQQQQGLT